MGEFNGRMYLDMLYNYLYWQVSTGKITSDMANAIIGEAKNKMDMGILDPSLPFFTELYKSYMGTVEEQPPTELTPWQSAQQQRWRADRALEQQALQAQMSRNQWSPYELARPQLEREALDLQRQQLEFQRQQQLASLQANPRDWIQKWYAEQAGSYAPSAFTGDKWIPQAEKELAIRTQTGRDPREMYMEHLRSLPQPAAAEAQPIPVAGRPSQPWL